MRNDSVEQSGVANTKRSDFAAVELEAKYGITQVWQTRNRRPAVASTKKFIADRRYHNFSFLIPHSSFYKRRFLHKKSLAI